MSEKLKPCPICGVNNWQFQAYFSGTTFYQCGECGIIVDADIINARPIEDELRKRVAELETKIRHNALWQASEDAEERAHLEKLVLDLKKRIAELEEQFWNLNLENERLEEAYWIDETISPDGTLKPSVRKLLERLEKAETDLRLSDDLVKALDNRIAKLEAENDQLTAHDATERQDDKCSKPEPNVCEACGGDGTVLLTDGYKGQVIATAKCIYCNGTGRVNKEREE